MARYYTYKELYKIDILIATHVMEWTKKPIKLATLDIRNEFIGVAAIGKMWEEMGLESRYGQYHIIGVDPQPDNCVNLPTYSRNIDLAWKVVEKYGFIDLSYSEDDAEDHKNYTHACADSTGKTPVDKWIKNESKPLAICLAILEAKGIDVDKELLNESI